MHIEYRKADKYRQEAKDLLELAIEGTIPAHEAVGDIVDLLIKAAVSYSQPPND